MVSSYSVCPELSCWFILAVAGTFSVQGCTEGFMDFSLLARNAAQIPTASLSPSIPVDDELRLPDVSFSCSGEITSLLLGVSVRQATPSREEFPQFQLWRLMATPLDAYTRVTTISIVLGPSNFSTSGVFEYPVDPPIQFENGDKIGWFQPKNGDSVVQMQETRERNTGALILPGLADLPTVVSIGSSMLTGSLLLRPVIESASNTPSCLSAFVSEETVRNSVTGTVAAVQDGSSIVLPEIRFTCSGLINKWIFGGTLSLPENLLQLRLHQSMAAGSEVFPLINSTVLGNGVLPRGNYSNVYEFSPDPPVEFHNGDILGLFQPPNSGNVVFQQVDSGPLNLLLVGPSTAEQLEDNNYPLITVEIATNTTETTSAEQSTVSIEIPSNDVFSTQNPSTSLPLGTSSTDTPSAVNTETTPTQDGSVQIVLVASISIAAAMSTMFLLLLLLTITVIIATKKNLKRERETATPARCNEEPLESNPAYLAEEPTASKPPETAYEDLSVDYASINYLDMTEIHRNIAYGVTGGGAKEHTYSIIPG